MLGSTRIPKKRRHARKPSANTAYSPKKRPRQARARSTFDSMVQAAARLLEQHGYAALTTNHVARAAGVAIGSLYEYFPGKEAVVAEVVRCTTADMLREVAEVFQQSLERGLEASLDTLVGAMFEAVGKRKALMRVLWMDVPFTMELDEVQALPGVLFALGKRGMPQASANWSVPDLEAATYLITVMVRSAVIESVVARPPGLSQRRAQEALVDLLERMLFHVPPNVPARRRAPNGQR